MPFPHAFDRGYADSDVITSKKHYNIGQGGASHKTFLSKVYTLMLFPKAFIKLRQLLFRLMKLSSLQKACVNL
jgi:hypothetical protein